MLKSNHNMEISWLGHSCFRLKGKQAIVITDPYSPDLGYSLGKQTANIVTISHQHLGHNFAESISGDPKIVSGSGEYEIGNVLFIGVATFHDKEKGSLRGKNTVYLIEIDDLAVCHLGDLGHVLTDEQVEELGRVDILLVPVGGMSTINAPAAAEVVRQLEPSVVIPMHYWSAQKPELDSVDAFLREMGTSAIAPQAKLSLTKSSLPQTTQVFLLEQ